MCVFPRSSDLLEINLNLLWVRIYKNHKNILLEAVWNSLHSEAITIFDFVVPGKFTTSTSTSTYKQLKLRNIHNCTKTRTGICILVKIVVSIYIFTKNLFETLYRWSGKSVSLYTKFSIQFHKQLSSTSVTASKFCIFYKKCCFNIRLGLSVIWSQFNQFVLLAINLNV